MFGAGRESSLALTWGKPLLQWMDPQDVVSALFTLDDVAESIEQESLDVGIASMLEALNCAMGALRDIVVPSGRVFLDPASCPHLPFSIFCILTIVLLQSLIPHSRENSWFLRQ